MINLLVIFGACILAMYLFKMSKRSKKQRGGINKKALGAILVLAGICSVVGYFVWQNYHNSSPTPSPTSPSQTSQSQTSPSPTSPTTTPSPSPTTTGAYIKYASSSRSWGGDNPCSQFSSWSGSTGTNANTDTSVTADDGRVICQVPSAGADGSCTGSCVAECSNYYGRSSASDDKLHICGATGRSDNKCVTSINDLFRVYTDSNCSGP